MMMIFSKKEKKMMKISDLPGDLVGEIFSRVPLTCLSLVRSTCKTWNSLSRNHTLGQKAATRKNQFLEFMLMHNKVYSLRVDLQEEEDYLVDSSLKLLSIPNTIYNQDELELYPVFHCNGLLLCVNKEHMRLIVWNPYLGQTRLIRPRRINCNYASDWYALGYDNNKGNFKILRVLYGSNETNKDGPCKCEQKNKKDGPCKILFDIYDFSSNSWRFIDVNSDWEVPSYQQGISLKRNTYFFGRFCDEEVARVTVDEEEVFCFKDYLLCFDFTRERFGPRLSMPFQPYPCNTDNWILSWVRDEKLVVAYSHDCSNMITEIWITTKIEPNAVSWSKFMTLDMRLIKGIPGCGFKIHYRARSFFIDEEKKIAVFLDLEIYEMSQKSRYQMAYIYGEDGYFKSVNMGRIPYEWYFSKLVSSSYVPSLVQLEINQGDERK